MQHVILTEAQDELDRAITYLNDQSDRLGDEFRQEVLATLKQVIAAPESGSILDDETKYRPVNRFRYVVVYAVRDDSIIVVAIMHEARRPGYWKKRLK